MQDNFDHKQEGMSAESIRLIVSPSNIARKTFLFVQEAGYLEVDSSYSVSLGKLDSFLLLDVVEGEGELIYEDHEYHLKADDMVFIDCKNFHKYYTRDTWNVLYLYFNGKIARDYYSLLSKDKVSIFKIQNSKTMGSLFWQIITLHKKYNGHAEHLTSLHITRILTEMCMFCDNELVLDTEYPVFVNDVFHHIDHFYYEKITLEMLSQLYSVSKFHLAREFKRCSGTTIKEYLATTRINRAKALLRYSNDSIEQIADKVGFYSSSHFIKQFHRR